MAAADTESGRADRRSRTENDRPAHDEQRARAVSHGHARVVEQRQPDVVQAGRRHEDREPRVGYPALVVLLERAVVRHGGVHRRRPEDVPDEGVRENDDAHHAEGAVLLVELLEEILRGGRRVDGAEAVRGGMCAGG